MLPPKIKHFFWMACSYYLPTIDCLRVKMVECDTKCCFCESRDETLLHVFRERQFARDYLGVLGSVFCVDFGSTFLEWVDDVFMILTEEEKCYCIVVCWSIWRCRNAKLWHGEQFTIQIVMQESLLTM